MGKGTEDIQNTNMNEPDASFSKMLTLDQVEEILNFGKPTIYSLVRSGELRAAQFGRRNVWRVREVDLAAYIDAAYARTADRIAGGELSSDAAPDE